MEAFILVNTKPAWLWKVSEEAAKIEGVKIVRAVTGQFDVVIYAEFENIANLGAMIEKIQSINGVVGSQTLIALPPSAYTLSPWPTRTEEESPGDRSRRE